MSLQQWLANGWLKKHKTCKVVLVEKTDRLYRNLKDWVEIDSMDLEIHLVKEAVVRNNPGAAAVVDPRGP